MALSDTTIKAAKPKDKEYKLTDEKGMYVLIKPNGSKYFRIDYRFAGQRKTLALGVYPETTLKEAREKRDTARKQISDGIDPSISKKIKKAGSIENTFKAVAEDFLITKKREWSDSHHTHIKQIFVRDVYPWSGNRP